MKDLFNLRAKEETTLRECVIERLHTKSIASAKESLFPAVPETKAPHAIEMLEAFFSPLLIGVQDNFSIGRRSKIVAAPLKLAANLPIVVYLSIECDGVGPIISSHWHTSRRRDIQNRESAVSQPQDGASQPGCAMLIVNRLNTRVRARLGKCKTETIWSTITDQTRHCNQSSRIAPNHDHE